MQIYKEWRWKLVRNLNKMQLGYTSRRSDAHQALLWTWQGTEEAENDMWTEGVGYRWMKMEVAAQYRALVA